MTSNNPAIEVKLNGKTLFIRKHDLEHSEGALMLRPDSDARFDLDEQYAHLYPECISRYGKEIGTIKDLEVAGRKVEV